MGTALCVLLTGTAGYQLPASTIRPHPLPNTRAVSRVHTPNMIDSDVLIGVGTLLASTFGGVALIAFTENAGKRNEATSNAQVCVECKGAKVTTCTICQGTGSDPYASLVAGVREMAGEVGGSDSGTIIVEDWASGPKAVVMYEEILSKYPPKVTENVCEVCNGRGVVVCDNCQGTGIQPRFLERYSPDDFMD